MAPASSADPNPPSDIHEIERATKNTRIVPRLVRFRDAPYYLGMDRNRFNSEVRPYLTEIPIGSQGIGFDRLELDAWLDGGRVTAVRYSKEDRAAMTRLVKRIEADARMPDVLQSSWNVAVQAEIEMRKGNK